MHRLSRKIVAFRIPILIIAVILLIPSVIGYAKTRVNYDILTYLPSEIETMQGQDILEEQFGTGAFSLFAVQDMPVSDVADLKARIEQVDHHLERRDAGRPRGKGGRHRRQRQGRLRQRAGDHRGRRRRFDRGHRGIACDRRGRRHRHGDAGQEQDRCQRG